MYSIKNDLGGIPGKAGFFFFDETRPFSMMEICTQIVYHQAFRGGTKQEFLRYGRKNENEQESNENALHLNGSKLKKFKLFKSANNLSELNFSPKENSIKRRTQLKRELN